MSKTVKDQMQAAKRVLDKNWTGTNTIPTVGLYPHQWSWDSAFIAIGYAHYNQQRAQQELTSLFRGQWRNGLLPNVVFNPKTAEDYFPGPDYWQIERSPDAPRDVRTSGIVQPPMHAVAVRHIYEQADDRPEAEAFLKRIYPKLRAWHDYLYRDRDVNGDGLVYIRHPWESGRDNSPVWDPFLKRFTPSPEELPEYQRRDTMHANPEERPSDRMYDCYIYLAEIFKDCDYDERRIRERCPFLVLDVLFNTILCQAEQDMAWLAEQIGIDGAEHRDRAERTAESMRSTLWSDEQTIYLCYDQAVEQRMGGHVASGFSPIYAGVPTASQARRICDRMDSTAFCAAQADCYAVPSYDRDAPGYSTVNYWRGPVWININWLLARGLRRYGFTEYHRWVIRTIVELTARHGFREHYSADTGEGGGAADFSWSAALALDVIYDGLEDELKDENDESNSASQ